MIAPLVPMAIRGTLWYQGESNVGNSQFYVARFAGLVKGWRKIWGQGDFHFHFHFIQLASYSTLQVNPVKESGMCRIREAQRLSLAWDQGRDGPPVGALTPKSGSRRSGYFSAILTRKFATSFFRD